MDLRKFGRIIRNHFGFPKTINWGYSLFICAIGTLLVYIGQDLVTSIGSFPSKTSLTGFTLISPALTVLALLLPACTLFYDKKHPKDLIVDTIGSFTGLGPLILAFLSGIALMLIRVPLHNLTVWLWLRIGRTPIFPAFFFVNDPGSKVEKVLSFIVGTVIPGFGTSMFFTGLMWACFSKKEKKLAGLIIALAASVFSLNFFDFIPTFVITLWLCFLRDTVNNVFGPFLALAGSGLMQIFFERFVKEVDITMIQVYSDIDSTYFYSSLPACLVGFILLMFLTKSLNEFRDSYRTDFTVSDDNEETPLFGKGINIALICAVIIFAVLWILLLRGDRK